MGKRLVRVVLFVMLIFLLAPKAEPQQKALDWGKSPKTLRIGEIQALTGPGSSWGLPKHLFLTMQVEKINASGGVTIGGDTYRIELIARDDKYKPDQAINAANQLIFLDKVKFLFGPTASAAALSVNSIAEANGVIHLPACWSEKILGPNKPHTWRVEQTISEIAPGFYQWMDKTYPQIKRWGLINPNDETGWAGSATCKSALKRIGKEIVVDEFYERGVTDFYPLLTRMIAKHLDVLDIGITSPGDGALMVKQARELGFKGKIISPSHDDVEALSKLAGMEAAEGFIATLRTVTAGPQADPKWRKLREDFIAYWGADKWDANTFDGSDKLAWVLHSIRKAASIDPAKVNAAMEGTREWDNPFYGSSRWAGMSFYGINHQQLGENSIAECRKGKEYILGSFKCLEPVR